MKPIKMLCLAALAALVAMASAAVPSAMAEETALCPSEKEKCKAISHVHETSVGKAKLLTSLATIECDVLFLGEAAEPGSPLIVEGNFTYSNCGSCTVEEVSGEAVVEVLKTGHETATVADEGEFHVSCSGLNCYYSSGELLGTGKGPLLSKQANGEVSIQEQAVKKVKGLFCPSTAKLDITTTPLSAAYIVEPHEVHALACLLRANGDYDDYKCESDILDKLIYALFAY